MCFVFYSPLHGKPKVPLPLRCETIARELSLGDGEHKVATGDGWWDAQRRKKTNGLQTNCPLKQSNDH